MTKSKSLNRYLEFEKFKKIEQKAIVLFSVKWEYFFGTPCRLMYTVISSQPFYCVWDHWVPEYKPKFLLANSKTVCSANFLFYTARK